jgi:hypothetical protein
VQWHGHYLKQNCVVYAGHLLLCVLLLGKGTVTEERGCNWLRIVSTGVLRC